MRYIKEFEQWIESVKTVEDLTNGLKQISKDYDGIGESLAFKISRGIIELSNSGKGLEVSFLDDGEEIKGIVTKWDDDSVFVDLEPKYASHAIGIGFPSSSGACYTTSAYYSAITGFRPLT